jgi:alpha-L-rhamnosidase
MEETPKYRDLGYGPQWEGAYVILSWYIHLYTGDIRILVDNYEGFCRYLDHLTRHAEDGIIRFGIDDHAPAITKTPPEDFATGFYYQIAQIVSYSAKLLGKIEDEEKYSKLAESIRDAYNKHLLNQETGYYASGSQTAQSAPLYFDIVDLQEKNRVLANLVSTIEKQNNHLDTGVVGTKFLINGLVKHNRPDIAYRIVSQTTFPSWGDWIRKGANTLWQKWDDSMSRNHVMFGDISAWMFKHIGGIQPDPSAPGFKHFFINPQFFPDLTWAKVKHLSPYGLIECSWRKNQSRIELDVNIPCNSSATVTLPKPRTAILESGKALTKIQGIQKIEENNKSISFHVTSGKYEFIVQ